MSTKDSTGNLARNKLKEDGERFLLHTNDTRTIKIRQNRDEEFRYGRHLRIVFEGRHAIKPASTVAPMVSKKQKLSKEEIDETVEEDQENSSNEEEKKGGEDNIHLQSTEKRSKKTYQSSRRNDMYNEITQRLINHTYTCIFYFYFHFR